MKIRVKEKNCKKNNVLVFEREALVMGVLPGKRGCFRGIGFGWER